MKPVLGIIAILLAFLGGDEGILGRAAAAWDKGEYLESASLYQDALASYPRQGAAIRYNLALCYLAADSVQQALNYFHQAAREEMPGIASHAWNHIGVLVAAQNQSREALSAFREALVLNPDNEEARYNYELLKKRLHEDTPPATPPPGQSNDKDRPTPPPPSLEEYQRLIQELKQRNTQVLVSGDRGRIVIRDTIPLVSARRLLDGMRQQQNLFVQQKRKSPVAPTHRDKKADW